MPRPIRGNSLPKLDSSAPPAPAIMGSYTAHALSPSTIEEDKCSSCPPSTNSVTATTPTTAVSSPLTRSGSKRLTRIAELLTPIREEVKPHAPQANDTVTKEERSKTFEASSSSSSSSSNILFFSPHPSDSSASLTAFLGDGAVAAGDSSSPLAPASGGRREREKSRASSRHRFSSTSPPLKEHDPLAGFERLDFQARAPPKRLGKSEPAQRKSSVEEMMMNSRPATLTEMPGRFRSVESCWWCMSHKPGERCKQCGALVRSRYGQSTYEWEYGRQGMGFGQLWA